LCFSCSARFKDELLPHLENKRVEVMWADDRIAALWANSEAAKAEFPDYSFLVSCQCRALMRQTLGGLLPRRKALLYFWAHMLVFSTSRHLAQEKEKLLLTWRNVVHYWTVASRLWLVGIMLLWC
jgi:hypothetical protein